MFPDIPLFDEDDYGNYHEYHGSSSVILGELIELGWFDLSKPEWDFPKFSDEQHARLCEKIRNRFWDREIGALPPGIWKRQFLAKMNEIMPKYIRFYKLLEETPDLLGAESEYYKARNIFSDFPQTLLSGNSDYASTGNDTEYERIKQLDILEFQQRLEKYRDVDQMILDEIEPLFSCLISVSTNAW